MTWPCTSCSAPPPGRPAGPSPTSSRPRSAPRRLRAIMVSIGRTGRATPFGQFDPVFVGGSTIGDRHLAQRGPGGAQGRAAGRSRSSCARRATSSPRSWDACARAPGCPSGASPSGPSRPRARRAANRWPVCPARATPTAPTSTARPSGCSASRTTPRARAMDIEGLGEERVLQLVGGRAGRRPGRPLRPARRAAGGARAVRRGLGDATWWRPIDRLAAPAAEPAAGGAGHPPPRVPPAPGPWPGPSARSTPSSGATADELAAVEGVGAVIAASVARVPGPADQPRRARPAAPRRRQRGGARRHRPTAARLQRPCHSRWRARRWWSPAPCPVTPVRGPRRPSSPGVGRRPPASRRRRSCWSSGMRPAPASSRRPKASASPPSTRPSFGQLLASGELPA